VSERRPATDRVLRMLSVVPWIAAHDGPTVEEVCARFGLLPAQLVEDLNVVQFVGLPPYTPDMLIDVTFEGDRVWVRFAEVFSRPLRLAPDQALALVAAGAAVSAAGGGGETAGPLQTGLAKLASLLGVAPEDAIAIRLGSSRPQVMDTLREAVRDHRRVHLDYFVYSRDERTERDVDPYRVFALRGAWYMIGWCHLVDAVRTFRIDRIYRAELLEATFEVPEQWTGADDPGGDSVFEIDPDVPRVTLDLPASARWVVETYPVDEVADGPDGRFRVRLPVASRVWLERLLLRLGRDAVLVDTTDPGLADVRQRAAQRVLARYRG
jgi:predicted DNA-binding transcriptional regulator YafY